MHVLAVLQVSACAWVLNASATYNCDRMNATLDEVQYVVHVMSYVCMRVHWDQICMQTQYWSSGFARATVIRNHVRLCLFNTVFM